MRILIALVVLVSLASCTVPGMNSTPAVITPNPEKSGATNQEPVVTKDPVNPSVTPEFATSGSVVTLNYTLHVDSPTGSIQETTLQSVAESNGLYKTGATYQPFQVALGQSQVIYGFEKGLMGVKKGEKKMIKVIPSEGYGRPVVLSKDQIAPEFTLVRDRKMFDKTLKQSIKKSDFPNDMKEKVANAKVGDTLTGAENAVAQVVEVTPDTITLTIENSTNPFYGKELIIGTVATTPDAEFKITAVDAMNVTLSIINKKSPFYDKTFAVGESITPENGSKITIKEITQDTVSILADHPLMTKELYFDVEIVDIQ